MSLGVAHCPADPFDTARHGFSFVSLLQSFGATEPRIAKSVSVFFLVFLLINTGYKGLTQRSSLSWKHVTGSSFQSLKMNKWHTEKKYMHYEKTSVPLHLLKKIIGVYICNQI